MCKHITTDINKSVQKALIDAKNLITKDSFGCSVPVETMSVRDYSPPQDIFVKEVVKNGSPSFCSNPITKIKTIIPLNKESLSSNFFGVTSAKNIQQKLHNQLALTYIKSQEQNIVNLPGISLESSYQVRRDVLNRFLNNLYEQGSGRLTMTGNIFGGEDATHTIGLVFDKNNNVMYVLDSLPSSVTSTYRKNLLDILAQEDKFGYLFERKHNGKHISYVFASKSQQQMNEYTCNNWAHANIEAVKEAIQDGKILNEEELNVVLPNDINDVLRSQCDYLTKGSNRSKYESILKNIFGVNINDELKMLD